MKHSEFHRLHRIGWLRAAVLGANDGILSTASLIIGVAAAGATSNTILMTGVAGLVAGAMSMAAGEYVSVSSQADAEAADLDKEREELENDHHNELKELTGIYIGRGLTPELAEQVAAQLTAHDALGAHARDELGITDLSSAQPLEAALSSAISFAAGAALPLMVAVNVPLASVPLWVAVTSLVFLALLGGLAANAGGASIVKGATRVVLWGALAMQATMVVGHWFGVNV
jgi:VIT1/CCC1 family predicted Fe2+/Mn2+ transporter